MIYPENMPEGYYLERPFEIVILTKEKPEASVTFTYNEIGDKKFTFTIVDNYDNAEYYLCDFYAWIGREDGEEYDYSEGMQLKPGFYYVKALADKERFGETTITVDGESSEEISRTFRSVTEPVEVNFNWKKYSETDKVSEGVIFITDEAVPTEKQKNAYEYVLTGTKGEAINKTFGKKDINSYFVNLPYDYYQVEVKGLPEGYTINRSEFIVNTKEFQVELKIVPKTVEPSEKVTVNVSFNKGSEKISPVTFKLGDKEFTDGQIEIETGTYKLEILSPEGLEATDNFKTITIDKDTKDLAIELKDKAAPGPSGEGTLKFQIFETDGTNEKQLKTSMMAYVNNELLFNDVEKTLPYGEYNVKLSSIWNLQGKYDEAKSKIEETVTIDEEHKNVVVKFLLFKKTATPDPTKGRASWDIKYLGSREGLKFFEKVKLYKVTEAGDEEIKLNFDQEYNHDEIELDYGKYAYELQDLPSYLKVEVKNKRIEFTLDKDNPTFKAVFEINDKKETQMIDVDIPQNADETLADYTFRVFDMQGNEVEDVKRTDKGFEFPAVSGAEYEIDLQGTKYAYYPNIIKAYPSPKYAMYVKITSPLPIKVNSLCDGEEIEAKYAVTAENIYGKVYQEDLSKVPYISTGTQVYKVTLLSNEEGYKLIGEDTQEFTAYDYDEYELTFNFERVSAPEVDKTELKETIDKAEAIKESDKFTHAPEDRKQDLEDKLAKAKEVLEDPNATKEEVDRATQNLKNAIEMIENLVLEKVVVTFDPDNGKDEWTVELIKGDKVERPIDPVKPNHTFIAWQFNGENYDFNASVMENIKLVATWKKNVVDPTPIPEPLPEPYEPTPRPRPYRPHRGPVVETKPVEEKKPETKPVEPVKKDGIITEYPQHNVILTDIPQGPEGDAIRNLVSYGIINCMGNGKFEVKLTITRAMFTKVFMAISKDKSISNIVNFTDVTADKWYAQPVMWAASKGIINGYTDGTFRPENKVSRQEFCVMLNNLLQAYDIKLKDVITVDENEFKDAAAWSKDAMIAMKKAGLVLVEANGKYAPESEFTRAELAKTLDTLINYVRSIQ